MPRGEPVHDLCVEGEQEHDDEVVEENEGGQQVIVHSHLGEASSVDGLGMVHHELWRKGGLRVTLQGYRASYQQHNDADEDLEDHKGVRQGDHNVHHSEKYGGHQENKGQHEQGHHVQRQIVLQGRALGDALLGKGNTSYGYNGS